MTPRLFRVEQYSLEYISSDPFPGSVSLPGSMTYFFRLGLDARFVEVASLTMRTTGGQNFKAYVFVRAG